MAQWKTDQGAAHSGEAGLQLSFRFCAVPPILVDLQRTPRGGTLLVMQLTLLRDTAAFNS